MCRLSPSFMATVFCGQTADSGDLYVQEIADYISAPLNEVRAQIAHAWPPPPPTSTWSPVLLHTLIPYPTPPTHTHTHTHTHTYTHSAHHAHTAHTHTQAEPYVGTIKSLACSHKGLTPLWPARSAALAVPVQDIGEDRDGFGPADAHDLSTPLRYSCCQMLL